jgi:PAS domain-containing protein
MVATNTIRMQQPPEPASLVDAIKEYWPYLTGVGTALAASVAFYRKYVRRYITLKAALVWLKNAFNAPNAIARIQVEMVRQEEFRSLEAKVESIRVMHIAQTSQRRALLQHVPNSLFEADNNGRLLWANATFLNLVDRELLEITGGNWRNCIHDLDRPGTIAEWKRSIEDATNFNYRFRVVTAQSEFWVQAEALCTKDDLGNVLLYAGEFRAISNPTFNKALA